MSRTPQVADVSYRLHRHWQVTARLIVRRVPDERRATVDDQGVLCPVWRYHAVLTLTDGPFILVQA